MVSSFPARGVLFSPSTDLNAAFEAAEKAGLFPGWFVDKGADGTWVVGRVWYCYEEDVDEDDDDENEVGWNYESLDGSEHATPAEAICRAILALKIGPTNSA